MADITKGFGQPLPVVFDNAFVEHNLDGTHKGAMLYVPRRVAAFDFTAVNFTTDGTWKVDGLNLSAIVPAGATAVHLRIFVSDDAAASAFAIRTNATDVINQSYTMVRVANLVEEQHAILALDANRLLDYQGSNLAFTNIDVAVLGWWI